VLGKNTWKKSLHENHHSKSITSSHVLPSANSPCQVAGQDAKYKNLENLWHNWHQSFSAVSQLPGPDTLCEKESIV